MPNPQLTVSELTPKITRAKADLDFARRHHDPLRVALAEGALNNLLERLLSQLSQVTTKDT